MIMEKKPKKPLNLTTKEGFNFEHFREVLEIMPVIQKKALQGIALNKKKFQSDRKHQLSERKYLTEFIEIVRGKWFIDVIYLINLLEKAHFNDLKKNLSGINSRTLTDRLRQLEEKKVISRHVMDTSPVRVYYTLTQFGKGMSALFIQIYLYFMFHEQLDRESSEEQLLIE